MNKGLFILAGVMLVGCGPRTFEFKDLTDTQPLEKIQNFESIRTQILVPHCQGCHAWVNQLSSVQANCSEVNFQVSMGWMPKRGSLQLEEKKTLLDWTANGCQDSGR